MCQTACCFCPVLVSGGPQAALSCRHGVTCEVFSEERQGGSGLRGWLTYAV